MDATYAFLTRFLQIPQQKFMQYCFSSSLDTNIISAQTFCSHIKSSAVGVCAYNYGDETHDTQIIYSFCIQKGWYLWKFGETCPS